MAEALFIQFARAPAPGRVKTRMLPALDPLEACELHRDLVLWTTRTLTGAGLGPVELHVTGSTASPLFQQCLGLGIRAVIPQRGGDLGARMCHALADGLAQHVRVVLVGSDCPQIDRDYLSQAVSALDEHDVVLGPAQDGGYVLIGARRVDECWFEGIDWGTGAVYAQTLARLAQSGACWAALETLRDIDRPEDLSLWRDIAGLQRRG